MKPSSASKKRKSPPAAPAPTPAEGAADTEACSRLPETLTLSAAAAVSETESSSSGEAFSSCASTASSPVAGEERRDLTWLVDAFASATIDQIDSAYREAGGDPFLAAAILGSTQDTQPAQPPQPAPQPPPPAPQPPPPPDLSPRSGSGGRLDGRRPKRVAVAATGMVADVIGKEYTRPATTPVSVPNAWKSRDGERDGGSAGRKEEEEQLLYSILGDKSEIWAKLVAMGCVRDRDVLGTHDNGHEALEQTLFDSSAEPIELSYGFLKNITKDFSEVIGSGGFGEVYMGVLRNGRVAVKKLFQTCEFSKKQFEQELMCLRRVKHKNIVRFLGYCSDTQQRPVRYQGEIVLAEDRRRFLCFEYVPNKSLHDYLKAFLAFLSALSLRQMNPMDANGVHVTN